MGIIKKKVVIAISGGVDSSAAAFLLQKQGYEVIGMFMKLAPLDSKHLTGFGVDQNDSEASARRVCQKLNIKFYPINFIARFRKEVIDYFADSYAQGLTPNPCVKCNQMIKFGSLLEQAKRINADYLATGHYSRNVERITPRMLRKTGQAHNAKPVYKLFRGKDNDKDQSYFLYNLTQKQLKRVLFPLGGYTKAQIRKIADKEKLPYLIKESQDICFLKSDHNDFLKEHIKLKPGPIVALTPHRRQGFGGQASPSPVPVPSEVAGKNERGRVREGVIVGEHQGLPLYTIGQRKGVEIGGVGPFYVAKCDYKTNTLYVVSGRDDPALYKDELIAKDVNWIAGHEPELPFECEAVIRYRHKPVKCKVALTPSPSPPAILRDTSRERGAKYYLVKFNKPQRAITPGQSIVFYNKDEVLGGGVIYHET